MVQLEPPKDLQKEGVKLKELDTQAGGKGWAAVEGSLARKEEFEREALAFELEFGKRAMKNKTAHEASAALSKAALDMLYYYSVALSNYKGIFDTYWKSIGPLLGEKSEKRAGAVGQDPVNVVRAIRAGAEGNVREQMTVVFNFGGALGKKLMTAKADKELFQRFKRRVGDKGAVLIKHLETQEGEYLISKSGEGPVAGQKAARGKRGEVEKSERTLEQGEELELTEREKKHMNLTSKEEALKWEEGAKVWYLNEADEWVKSVRKVSLPLKAGPSGTTDRLMQTRDLLNVSTAEATRAACLAYLLPINAHSLVEILVAAKPYGAGEVVMGPGIYKEIEPFDTEIGQLRSSKTPSEGFWQKVDT